MPGYLWWQDVCVTAPCDANICDYDTIVAIMAYCDTNIVCAPDCGDCEDPNMYGDPPAPYYSVDTLILHIVQSPPALYVLQDSIGYVDQGQTAAYIPFEICNGDPCADPTDYTYVIDSKGHIGGGFPQGGSVSAVPGGECADVYAEMNAGVADVCDYDTLTIIAWDTATGTVYDTCVQLIHVVEPEAVPLFTRPVVTILVLAMILAAAVIMRRRALSKA
jgi:hypothetical protein